MHKQKPKNKETQREKQMLSLQKGKLKKVYEILTKQAEGYKEVVAAAGGITKAFNYC
jgi:hypothetical protein